MFTILTVIRHEADDPSDPMPQFDNRAVRSPHLTARRSAGGGYRLISDAENEKQQQNSGAHTLLFNRRT
jgi:hypothetical protein